MQIVSKGLLNVLTLWNSKVSAMALWPFILFKDRSCQANPVILNHERIHHRQQLELLILPFYVWYFLEYWWQMIQNKMNHDKAYRKISFEKEAYANEKNMNYLKERKFASYLKYISKK